MKKLFALILALAVISAAMLPGFAEEYPPVIPEVPETPIITDPTIPVYPGSDPVIPTYPGIDPTVPIIDPGVTMPTDPNQPTIPISTGYPAITKHPTDENPTEGGVAEFVARADNCTEIVWLFTDPSTGREIEGVPFAERFPGMIVYGLGSEHLILDRVPRGVAQWRVRAKFVGLGGDVYSNYAFINVTGLELKAPSISQQPESVQLRDNEMVNLRVGAFTADSNARLTYQWYMNTTESNVGGKAIYSATSETYIPEYIPGTTYYYCSVRTTDGNRSSAPTKTQCAAVTYSKPVETTVPTTLPETIPTTAAPTEPPTPIWADATEDTTPAPGMSTPALKRGNSLLLLLVAVIVLIAILGIVATVLILKFYPNRDDEDDEEDAQIPPRPRKASRYEQAKPAGKPSRYAPPAPAPKPRQAPQKAKKKTGGFEITNNDPDWDDLSDLGDLSIYFDDEQ